MDRCCQQGPCCACHAGGLLALLLVPAIMLDMCSSCKTVILCQLSLFSLFHGVTPCLCLQEEYKQLGWHLVEP